MALAAPFPSVRAPRAAGAIRLTRRGRLVVFLGATLILSGAVIGSGQLAGASDTASLTTGTAGPATAVVVVQPGESLWSIAQAVSPGADPRAMVLRLRELNGLQSAVVVPGQSLVVPA